MEFNLKIDPDDPNQCILTLQATLPKQQVELIFGGLLNSNLPATLELTRPTKKKSGVKLKSGLPFHEDPTMKDLFQVCEHFRLQHAWPSAKTTFYYESLETYCVNTGRIYRDYFRAMLDFGRRDDAKGVRPWWNYAKANPALFTEEDLHA